MPGDQHFDHILDYDSEDLRQVLRVLVEALGDEVAQSLQIMVLKGEDELLEEAFQVLKWQVWVNEQGQES